MPSKIKATIQGVDSVIETTEKTLVPIRQSLFRRFPALFTLLVTFGISATIFGLERILTLTPLFNDHPWFTMGIGITILMVTGKLYAKLG